MNKEKLSDFFSKNKNMRPIYIILIIGIIILLFAGSASSVGKSKKTSEETKSLTLVGEQTKQSLEKILSKIRGVGEVEVMITYEGSGQRYYASDTTNENSISAVGNDASSQRTQSQFKQTNKLIYNSGEPVVSKESYPKAVGVIVVCDGGADAAVKNDIISAVKSVLDVADHRVCVFAKK